MTTTTAVRYAVRCRDYTTPGFTTRDQAERKIASIEALDECGNVHEIIEVDRDGNPVPDPDDHGPGCDGPLNCVCSS